MLRGLVETSLRQRYIVILAGITLLIYGGYAALQAPYDVFPEFAPPLIDVQTEAPGMSSEAVENLISIPIESALNGIPHMTTLRSKSVQGVSQVVLLFERGADMVKVRQMVTERLSLVANSLPAQAKAPTVLPPLSSTSRVLHLGFTPKKSEAAKHGSTL